MYILQQLEVPNLQKLFRWGRFQKDLEILGIVDDERIWVLKEIYEPILKERTYEVSYYVEKDHVDVSNLSWSKY